MVSIDIDTRGMGTIGIADAAGARHDYHVRLAPRGLSAWAVELRRVDADEPYLVRFFRDGKGECDCPGEKYRKRGGEHCKHLAAMRSFRAWLDAFLSTNREVIDERQQSAF